MSTHIVAPGDTLTIIGKKTGHPWQDIARLNNIPPPYIIRVGQALRLPAPVIASTPGIITLKTYTKTYNGRPARIFVARVPIARTQADVIYGPGVVSRLGRGYDLAVNASFFAGNVAIGRHIKDGRVVNASPVARPIIIMDDWSLNTGLEWADHLRARGVKNTIASYPVLIRDGIIGLSEHPTSLALVHPRTAIGRAGITLIVLVVDGRRAGYSLGVTTRELAEIMWQEGCRQWALNLDGGGSSAMWNGGKIVNRPSDGRERTVVNTLCFKVKSAT